MCILSFVTFFPRMLQLGYDWPQWFHSMCINFGRILYPFSITLILLPTILGIKNSFFTTILDTKFFNFVSRISYGIFLIHGMVIFHINWSNKQDTYLSINNTYVNTLSAIAQSCLLGFITTITV
jgi:peptidoglycan/LPS O-acetylase OafA/YrhL